MTPTHVLTLKMEKTPIQVTIRCSGWFVADNCEELRSAARTLVPTTKILAVDLAGVDYIDSSGLGAIIGMYVTAKRSGCRLKLINLSPQVKELMNLTKLTEGLVDWHNP